MIDTIASIGLSLLILLQAVVVRRIVGTWFFPAAAFGLFWFILSFFPIVLALGTPISPLAMGFIAAACIVFSLSGIRREWAPSFAQAKAGNGSAQFETPFLFQTFIASSLLALAGHVVNMLMQGFSLSDLMTNLLETANTYTVLRYNESLTQNIFNQVATVLTYIAAMTGGLVFLGRQGALNSAFILAMSFLPSLLIAATQSAKGALFLSGALFLGAAITYMQRSNKTRFLTLSSTVYGVGLVAAILIVVTASFLARLGALGNTDYLARYFLSYSSTHLFAFSDWFSWYLGDASLFSYRTIEPANGFYTFTALFQAAGDDRFVPLGTFDEVYEYSFYLVGNLYTIFRGMIIDFGIPGSLAVIFTFGWISHQIYMSMLKGRYPNFAIAFSIMLYGAIYHSYLASMAMYLSMYVAFALMWLVLFANSTVFTLARQGAPRARGYVA